MTGRLLQVVLDEFILKNRPELEFLNNREWEFDELVESIHQNLSLCPCDRPIVIKPQGIIISYLPPGNRVGSNVYLRINYADHYTGVNP